MLYATFARRLSILLKTKYLRQGVNGGAQDELKEEVGEMFLAFFIEKSAASGQVAESLKLCRQQKVLHQFGYDL